MRVVDSAEVKGWETDRTGSSGGKSRVGWAELSDSEGVGEEEGEAEGELVMG